MNYKRWQKLMGSFSMNDNPLTYEKIVDAYSEKHRFYHNQQHIMACLKHLDQSKHLASEPHQIEIALWFHDVIYKPRSKNNELESAQWAKEFLAKNNQPHQIQKTIYELIMVTIHNGQTQTSDQELLVDIDLSILGSRQDIYDDYENHVRKEYKWVPKFIFNRKRIEILNAFLEKETIFNTKYFIEKYDQQARCNLQRAIEKLQ